MTPVIEAEIRQFIKDNFVFQEDHVELVRDESLLDAGLIDSTGILELIEFLETRFQIQVADEDIMPEKLDSISSIAAYVESKLANADGPPGGRPDHQDAP